MKISAMDFKEGFSKSPLAFRRKGLTGLSVSTTGKCTTQTRRNLAPFRDTFSEEEESEEESESLPRMIGLQFPGEGCSGKSGIVVQEGMSAENIESWTKFQNCQEHGLAAIWQYRIPPFSILVSNRTNG